MLCDVWNLSPADKACFVAKLIEVLVMLVVCKAYAVGPHLKNQREILFMHLLRKRIAHSFTILMSGDTSERIASTIQKKAFFSIKCEESESNFIFQAINNEIPTMNFSFDLVQKRIFKTVPQAHRWNPDFDIGSLALCYCRNTIGYREEHSFISAADLCLDFENPGSILH